MTPDVPWCHMKNTALSCVVCILMLGCSGSGDTNRVVVRNRLRLMPTSVDLPESDAIRLRVHPGRHRTTLWPRRVNIKRGAITFHGAGGYIRLTTNNTAVIKSESLDREVVVAMTPGTQQVQFHLSQPPFRMSINWSTTPSLTEYCEINNCSYMDLCPSLPSTPMGSSIQVDIPMERSADFEGEVSDWVIQSNWK